jgi:hypothetical protein
LPKLGWRAEAAPDNALCLLAGPKCPAFGREAYMRRGNIIKKLLLFRLIRKLPFFPLIPLGPAALLVGSFVVSIRALGRVKRLEQRLAATAS